jgi:hypothetical protein
MIVYEHNAATFLIWMGVLVAIGIAMFSTWYFVQRNPRMVAIAALRALFVALLAWCLFMPGRKEVLTRTQKPRFVVMLDASRSMRLSPTPEIPDRWTAAQDVLAMDWTTTVGAECDIEAYAFANDVGPVLALAEARALEPDGASTLLRDALKRITARYAGLNVAGALLLSDGMDTREAVDDWASEQRPFPIYTVRLEPESGWEVEPDVRIDAVTTPRRVTVDWKSELKAVVSGQGTGGRPVTVQLTRDDALRQELPILIPDGGGARDVTFELEHPEIGVFTYRVAVPALTGETHTNDNVCAVSVQVITSRNHLLYVEGPPRWESKYLGRALKTNQQMTPLVFLRGPEGQFMTIGQAGSMTPEMREDQLAFFKIVILGNLDAKELGDARANNLVTFVDAGGSLVLLGGSKAWGEGGFAASPLRKLIPARQRGAPVAEGDFPVRITDTGRAHPAFAGDPGLWEIIPPVRSIFPYSDLSPGARALVEVETPTGTQPLVATLRYGQGKVAAVFTDSLWKWQLSPDTRSSQPYRRFWDQVIAWLAPEEEALEGKILDCFVDREQLFLGDELEITARGGKADALDETTPVQCLVTGPDNRTVPFAMTSRFVPTASGQSVPGRAFTFQADQPGLHMARASADIAGRTVQSDPVSFFVKPFTPESVPRPANTPVLQAIADAGKGHYHDTAEALNRALNALDFHAEEEEISEYHSLWQSWIILGSLIGLLTVEWVVRKMGNMP